MEEFFGVDFSDKDEKTVVTRPIYDEDGFIIGYEEAGLMSEQDFYRLYDYFDKEKHE